MKKLLKMMKNEHAIGNIVKKLNISQCSDFDPVKENAKEPILKATLKHKKILTFCQFKLNHIRILFLVLSRSVYNNLKKKIAYSN